MSDFFREDQSDWWDSFVDNEVYEMRKSFDTEVLKQNAEDFDLDVPF